MNVARDGPSLPSPLGSSSLSLRGHVIDDTGADMGVRGRCRACVSIVKKNKSKSKGNLLAKTRWRQDTGTGMGVLVLALVLVVIDTEVKKKERRKMRSRGWRQFAGDGGWSTSC